ncbi:hypothetical protein LINPERPRIM_LOCUS17589 [Linum perenne]
MPSGSGPIALGYQKIRLRG